MFVELEGLRCRTGIQVVPHLCTNGVLRVGAVATLIDVAAGAYATRAVSPNWVATCDLVLHTLAPVAQGTVIAVPRKLRHGKTTLVVEVDVFEASNPDRHTATGTVTFSILESRGAIQRTDPADELIRTEFALPTTELAKPIIETMGVEVVDASLGQLKVALTPYLGNTLGAVQGGAIALLAEASAELAGRHIGDAGWVTRDMVIHYLSLGKVGPLSSRAKVLRSTEDGALLRVELYDEGRDRRLLTTITAEVGPAS
ncbi:MAG: acyl-coenzyme A thioesterase PaaI-like protein [Myxococcota bacterium]|jgi:acyl-coenzyme A thioesterase PaaI-like protein